MTCIAADSEKANKPVHMKHVKIIKESQHVNDVRNMWQKTDGGAQCKSRPQSDQAPF
jgi:hypothetical protein